MSVCNYLYHHGEQYVNDVFDSITKKAKANMAAQAAFVGDPNMGRQLLNKIAF